MTHFFHIHRTSVVGQTFLPLPLPWVSLREDTERTDGDSVDQTEGSIALVEGKELFLNCTYVTSASLPNLFWYIQLPGEGPQLLLKHTSGKEQEETGNDFYAKLNTTEKSFHLRKQAITVGDSAMYYCAVSQNVEAGGGKKD
uniref:Ig-like domain-containing protein n=1 Tax=Ornithorhynchus anatinus TaxID=9258 RepID=F7GDJ7_ORNAN